MELDKKSKRYFTPLRTERSVVDDLNTRIVRHKRKDTFSGRYPPVEEVKQMESMGIEDRWTRFELAFYKDSNELKNDFAKVNFEMHKKLVPAAFKVREKSKIKEKD